MMPSANDLLAEERPQWPLPPIKVLRDRFAAAVVDASLMIVGGVMVVMVAVAASGGNAEPREAVRYLLAWPLIYSATEITFGGTLGKHTLSLRIVAASGAPAGFVRRLIRWALRRIFWVGLLLLHLDAGGGWLSGKGSLPWLDDVVGSLTVAAWLVHPLGMLADPSRGTWDRVCGTRVQHVGPPLERSRFFKWIVGTPRPGSLVEDLPTYRPVGGRGRLGGSRRR
jgi:uncharacterized RDD family membrane protein YckC